MFYEKIILITAVLLAIFFLWQCLSNIKSSALERKGIEGEKKLKKVLRSIRSGGRILSNLYIFNRDSSTEIDVVYIHKTGIYVLENKNFQGVVIGEESDFYWIYDNGRNKHRFYNPVKQNAKHVYEIKSYLKKIGFKNVPIWPVVVFSDSADILMRKRRGKNFYVCKQEDLHQYIKNNEKKMYGKCLNKEAIDFIYKKLKPLTRVSAWKKYKHKRFVKNLVTENMYQ